MGYKSNINKRGRFVFILVLLSFLCVSFSIKAMSSENDDKHLSRNNSRMDGPWDAVTYIEYPEGGPFQQSGRAIKSQMGKHGLDINSKIKIQIATDLLRARLATSSALTGFAVSSQNLINRIQTLDEALGFFQEANDYMKNAVDLFETAVMTKSGADYNVYENYYTKIIKEISDKIDKPLLAAITLRLESQGFKSQSIEINREIEKISGFAFQGKENLTFGVNWNALRIVIQNEINHLEDELIEHITDVEMKIQLRAYLEPKGGKPRPIHLPKYNEVEDCVARRVDKVRFALNESDKKMLEDFKKLAIKMESAKSLGQAFLNQLEAEYNSFKSRLIDQIKNLDIYVNNLKPVIDYYKIWSKQENITNWINLLKDELTIEVQTVFSTKVDSLKNLFLEVNKDYEAFLEFINIPKRLQGQTAENALAIIFDAVTQIRKLYNNDESGLQFLNVEKWNARFEEIKTIADELAQELNSLATSDEIKDLVLRGKGDIASPFRDLDTAVSAIKSFPAALQKFGDDLLQWIGKIAFGYESNKAASEYEIPQGQKRLDLHGNVDTEFNLQTICGDRNTGDGILVIFEFFQGESETPFKMWSDEFVIKSFGFNANPFPHVAFVYRLNDEGIDSDNIPVVGGKPAFTAEEVINLNNGLGTYKPHAAVTWTGKVNPYPGEGDTGLEDPWYSNVGFGFSTINLDFSNDETIELGLSLTLTLWGDRIIAGYGYNLNVDKNNKFWFFSFRVESLFSNFLNLGKSIK